MAAKKLVSMRISDIVDEKLSSLSEETGESKSNMISVAVNALYEKQQEEKRHQEAQTLFQNFVSKHFIALYNYPKERKIAIRFVKELNNSKSIWGYIDSTFNNTFYPEYEEIPDAVYVPIKETLMELYSIILNQLELHDNIPDT